MEFYGYGSTHGDQSTPLFTSEERCILLLGQRPVNRSLHPWYILCAVVNVDKKILARVYMRNNARLVVLLLLASVISLSLIHI